MTTYHPDLLAAPVPRYTSYPTAADFHPGIGPADMAAGLASVEPDETVSLYLHIPFCREICWYCGCNTGTTGSGDRLSAYLERLTAEVALVANALGGRGRVGRIAFGGGSPNAVSPAAFAALLADVRYNFRADDALVSVEIDPRGLDAEWAAMLRTGGVTRASLGVQTLSPVIQAAIGRIQPAATIENAVELLRRAGIDSLNFDLMYGLPGQRREDLAETLAHSLRLSPDRLAVFGYAHVPHLIPRQRQIDASALPDNAERFAQAALAHDQLTTAGYRAIGFDHFARPGDPLAIAAAQGRLRRNFQGFTDDDSNVTIGLGVSAISVFPSSILQNEKHSGRYHLAIGKQQFATVAGCRRTTDDLVRGRIIEAILATGYADVGLLADSGEIRRRLGAFESTGLLSWSGSQLQLAAGAMPYARAIAAAFDSYRASSQQLLSNAV